jgi:hypothetical protein
MRSTIAGAARFAVGVMALAAAAGCGATSNAASVAPESATAATAPQVATSQASSPRATTSVAATLSGPTWAADILAFTQSYNAVYRVCPNPVDGNPPSVVRPATMDGCMPAIENFRSIAKRFLADLPLLDVSASTRANLQRALPAVLAWIDTFENVELHGTDDQIGNVVHGTTVIDAVGQANQ